MRDVIRTGNLDRDTLGERGWFIGHFAPEDHPFHSDNFEVKWSRLDEEEEKPSPAYNRCANTLLILVYGELEIDFPDAGKRLRLKQEGDYVYFGPGVRHQWKALVRTLAISIRWPSLPADQVASV